MKRDKKERLINRAHEALQPCSVKERRQILWCMLMGSVFEDKEGLRWVKKKFYKVFEGKNAPIRITVKGIRKYLEGLQSESETQSPGRTG